MELDEINFPYSTSNFGVPGLKYIENYITQYEHDTLLTQIYEASWMEDLKRRVQHYGYRYDYKKKLVDSSMKLGELPSWAQGLAHQLRNDGLIEDLPDQLIVNEYKPGQGIAAHIDCKPCFSSTIISLSLGSTCMMDFFHSQTEKQMSLLLQPCSLLVLQGEARYQWKHGIRARRSDTDRSIRLLRLVRVSLTFRKVVLESSSD